MTDFDIRADSVNVRELMDRVAARIGEKRGVDYTEREIQELATVRVEKLLDPLAVRSDLLQRYQATREERPFGRDPLFRAARPIVARIRRRLQPVLRLFFNPDPITDAFARLDEQPKLYDLYFELLHNLVVELTRTSIEVRNLKVQVESLTGRLEFDERRARALESVVAYRPTVEAASDASTEPAQPDDTLTQRVRRLRRQRSRAGRAAVRKLGEARSRESTEPGDDNKS